MNREEIKNLLPHREPMLLVDEITVDEEGTAHGLYRVRGDEFFLQGHFPGNPVVPGVILCEIMAQACGLLIGDEIKGKTPVYTGLDKVRFRNSVRPGDETVADLIVDGCNMGVKSLTRYQNQYPAASGHARALAGQLIDAEEQLSNELRRYL